MIMKLFLILSIILLPFYRATAQWQLINPLPFETKINSSFFINENIGWVACDQGEIYKTSNGGENWVYQESGTTLRLQSIYFVNELLGFISGWDGIILKTTNAGINWEIKANNLAYYLNSIFFVDESNGWAVGYNGKIYYSIDGGENWIEQLSNITSALMDVYFDDNNTGWAVGWNEANSGNKIIKTTNGGIFWNTVYSDFTQDYLYSIIFINSLVGFAAGQGVSGGKILATQDGGLNWQQIYQTSSQIDWFSSIFFSDSLNGWAVGGFNNLVVHTTDGGQNWFEINSGINEPQWDVNNTVFFVSNYVGWVFNCGRVMYKTTDGGVNWVNQSKDFLREDLVSVEFLNELNGFAVDYNTKILKTSDGGFNWTSKYYNVNNFSKIIFIDDHTGFIVGTKNRFIPPSIYIPQGVIIKTTNEGINWSEAFTGDDYTEFKDIFFITSSIGWLSGDIPGLAFKTSDGGLNWTLQGSQFNPEVINSLFFFNENYGFSAGNKIYKTTNSGINWTELSFVPNSPILLIYFLDFNIGFIVGSGNNELYKTTDGGESWNNVVVEPASYFKKIKFVNNNNGYILSIDGFYITTDQGLSWSKQKTPYHFGLSDFSFIDASRGWVVGSSGFIMKTTNGGITFIENEGINLNPNEFLVNQNYPNPFNPSTKISWQSPVSGWQKLKVYDVLGNEVASLVNEYRIAGSYKVEFNANDLPSGVYFYRLQVGNFVETKKMILIQ